MLLKFGIFFLCCSLVYSTKETEQNPTPEPSPVPQNVLGQLFAAEQQETDGAVLQKLADYTNINLDVLSNSPLSTDILAQNSEDETLPEPQSQSTVEVDEKPIAEPSTENDEDETFPQDEEELLEQPPNDDNDNEELSSYDADQAETQYDETHADNTLATRGIEPVSPSTNNAFDKYIIHETLLDYGPPHLLIASLVIYGEMETLKDDATAAPIVHHMEKEMLGIYTDAVGSETVKGSVTKMMDLARDPIAHKTVNKILDSIMMILTYNIELSKLPGGERVDFPWEEFRVLINAHGLYAIPIIYHGLWNIETDKNCKNSFETIIHCMMDSAKLCTVPPRFAKADEQRQATREIMSTYGVSSKIPYSD